MTAQTTGTATHHPPATFVCLHGAGGHASHWDLVAAELRSRGHDTVAMDLPSEQEVGLDAYVGVVLDAIGDRTENLVVVAQSMAGFVAPLVADRASIELMVLVAAMVPRPGETGHAWWHATGHAEALAEQGLPDDEPETIFVHDVTPAVLAASSAPRDQTSTLFDEPWPLEAWPDVDTRFIACRDDRFFPLGWLCEIVSDRLGIEPDVIPGGHCAFLSQPVRLAETIETCWIDHVASSKRRR